MSKEKMYKYDMSVIIPIYNCEKYIDESIESLMNQNYDFNKIEVILINDGSVDNSLKVCKKYSESYDNVILIDQKNSGVSTSRNNGMKKASGKYIMLLDGDDFLSSSAIKNIVSFFDANYDEIDLVTYPLYLYNNEKSWPHARYNAYDKGTGIYDLEEYIHLNQNTVNVVIKNEIKNKYSYDTNMMLSEDQKFNTQVLMEKKKIGFVEKAIYYYRRVGTGASSVKNNPFICFEDIISYNEWLLDHFKEKGKIPKYVQSLVIHTINWRINSDQLFPYSYEEQEYKKAVERVHCLIKQIDVDVICNSKLPVYNKLYYLNVKNKKCDIEFDDDTIYLKCEGNEIYEKNVLNAEISRYKIKNGMLNIYLSLLTPLVSTGKIELFIETVDKNNNIKNEKLKLLKSNRLYRASEDIENITYNIDVNIDTNKIKKFKFYGKLHKKTIPLNCTFNRFCSSNIVADKKVHIYNRKRKYPFKIKNANILRRMFVIIKSDLRALKLNPKAFIVRIAARMYPTPKNIHIYSDRHDGIDNAYYLFKHDFKKKDNVARYYISNMDDKKLNELFTEEEKKNIIKFKSKKHRLLFLKSKKIYTSFVDLQVYCPFNLGIKFYRDFKNYDLIYLQHGMLHAHLVNMYSKEFKEIDNFVISSHFEEKNLINNYCYSEKDLVKSTMPRMKAEGISNHKSKGKILFAPSWRKYLIGNLADGKRDLLTHNLKESSFYKGINDFLKSKELHKLLKEKNMVLEFKPHPIFIDYKDLFYTDDRVKISFENVDMADYDLFITDFSSFQFDFINLLRPIMYFVPDYKEFVSGMHTYRKLDLDYKDAFGKLYKDSNDLVKAITALSKNNFKIDDKYKNRMKGFFFDVKDPCEMIYKETNK